MTKAILFSLFLAATTSAAASDVAAPRDLMSDTWNATDALGRVLPGAAECGPPRPGKFVGIFYFLWMGAHSKDVYDNTKLIAVNPADPQYGPSPAFHWWGEPQLGYYLSDDDFVINKHVQMLTDAGVDVMIFDVTNAFTYDSNVLAVCKALTGIRQTGRTTPQIAFLTHSSAPKVIQKLYDWFYSKNLYPDLWFRWKGKPLILGPSAGVEQKTLDFFTIRDSWAWQHGKDQWAWIDNYPQQPGWHEDPAKPEEISVCVAEHPTSNIGRSFHDGKEPPTDQYYLTPDTGKGPCFAEQWKRALQVSPEFIFVTGWNEWVAQRFKNSGGIHFLGKALKVGETFFVDNYNQEFSRDIEPMKGGHGDNYYYQLAANIRRFKGVRPAPQASLPKSIRIGASFREWFDVQPTYLDDIGDAVHRNHAGWTGAGPYINDSGRNDFDTMKVERDAKNLYFYVRTVAPISAPTGSNWMLLLINTHRTPRAGWEGFDFIVNRTRKDNSKSILEKNTGGKWQWEPVSVVKMAIHGNEMQIAIPRNAIGLDAGPVSIDFKWADNVPESGNIQDFTDHGDTAPNGRFSYCYRG